MYISIYTQYVIYIYMNTEYCVYICSNSIIFQVNNH